MDEVVQTVEYAVGFADAIGYVLRYIVEFINTLLPTDVSVMFGIGFTVMVAIAIKRGVLT